MNTGDLVMFRGRGFLAWLIRTWTRSAWNHCGILVRVEGVLMVIEARYKKGVVLTALANRLKDGPDIYPTGRIIDVPRALSRAGDTYSTKDAVRAGLNFPGDHAGWECAEFAAFCYGLDHPAKGWTPQNLIEHLSQRSCNGTLASTEAYR